MLAKINLNRYKFVKVMLGSLSKQLIQGGSIIMPDQKNVLQNKLFDKNDQDLLSENEYWRFMPSSTTVGHALITHGKDGKILAEQWDAPGGNKENTPAIKRMKNLAIFKKYGRCFISGESPGGTKMLGKRKIKFVINKDGAVQVKEFWKLSPESAYTWKGSVFYGGGKLNPKLLIQI